MEICNHVQFLKHSHNDALQKNILDWLAQNFQNPEINAAMTAEQFKISKKYLSQFLKEQTGKELYRVCGRIASGSCNAAAENDRSEYYGYCRTVRLLHGKYIL